MRSIRRRTAPTLWEAFRTRRSDRDRQGGQAIVMFALVIVVILAMSALVIDVGMLRNDRQQLVNALDAGALAGAAQLPVDGTVSGAQSSLEALVESTVQANYPGIDRSQYTIAYRCQVGVTGSNAPDLSQIPANCDPTNALGHTPAASDFSGAGDRRSSACDPSLHDRCNTVVVTGSVTQQYGFGPVVGVDSGSTGGVQSASCNGPCGAVIDTPVDVVLIVDRTGSMCTDRNPNPPYNCYSDTGPTGLAKDAAQQVVDMYRAKNGLVHLAFAPLGPSKAAYVKGTMCPTALDPVANGKNMGGGDMGGGDLGRWVPAGLTGTAAGFDQISTDITCYDTNGWTDLADPIVAATYELTHNGRPDAVKGIILETDGQPNKLSTTLGNESGSSQQCSLTEKKATAAKNAGIIIYTVGFFGADDMAPCPDSSGKWDSANPITFLASLSGTDTAGSVSLKDKKGNRCIPDDNTNGDYFFCTRKEAPDLSSIFDQVAQALAQTGPTLISLYPPPIVTGVGSPAQAGTDVAISGDYLSGATKVTFGGAASGSFTVTSDTSITARVPNGSGTVQVLVTTPGGTSYQDVEFTYSP